MAAKSCTSTAGKAGMAGVAGTAGTAGKAGTAGTRTNVAVRSLAATNGCLNGCLAAG